jgi:hypothetical protein
MGKPITLFSGYSQAENRMTNYCLLMLRMLYEENPKFLAEVLSTLVGEDLGQRIGVEFRQQEKQRGSTPDGLIVQQAFTIYLETKNFDWFYDAQLQRHLDGLHAASPGLKVLIALANFESDHDDRFAVVRALCAERYDRQIAFKQVSFEDFIQALRLDHLPKNLADAVEDLKSYLDEQGLLPSWKRWLDVVNCAGLPDDILVRGVYMCPATGGSYNHSRCRFFGMYRGKRVEQVAEIEAMVDVEGDHKATVRWKNTDAADKQLIERARSKVAEARPGEYPTRVLLLGQLYETDFRKDSPGGMRGSKQYFDVGGIDAGDAQALAKALRGRSWSDYGERSLGG